DIGFTATLGPASAVVLQKPANAQVPGPMTVRAEDHDQCGNLVSTDNTTAFTISVTEATTNATAYFSAITTGTALDTTNPQACIAQASLASFAADGTVTLALQTTYDIDCFCPPDSVSVELSYPAGTTADFTP